MSLVDETRTPRCPACGGYCENVQTRPGVSVQCDASLYVPCEACGKSTGVTYRTLYANGAMVARHPECCTVVDP